MEKAERISIFQEMWDDLHDVDKIEKSKRLAERKVRMEARKVDTGV